MTTLRITETTGEDWVAINLFKDCDSMPFVIFRSFPGETRDTFLERIAGKVFDMSNKQIDIDHEKKNKFLGVQPARPKNCSSKERDFEGDDLNAPSRAVGQTESDFGRRGDR